MDSINYTSGAIASGASRSSRRRWLASAAVPCVLALSCARKKAKGYAGFALIASSTEPIVSAIDLRTFQLEKSIKLDGAPSCILANAKRSLAYVAVPSSGNIHALSPSPVTRKKSFHLTSGIDALVVADGSNQLIAATSQGQKLIFFDLAQERISKSIALPAAPISIDSVRHGDLQQDLVAVSLGKQGVVMLGNLATGEKRTLHIEGELGKLRFRKDGRVVLVANLSGRSLLAIDTEKMMTIVELPLAMQPDNLCFSNDGGQLFITGAGMDGLAIVFPFQTIRVEQTILAGRMPGALACSAKPTDYLFVADRDSSGVGIFNIETRKLVALTKTGAAPSQIGLTPDSRFAFILNRDSGSAAVIQVSAIHGGRSRSGAGLFRVIAVGDNPSDIAFLDSGSV